MSKVKIQGNASGTGTLTISAPNTNTDRSLTLPDGAGEILLSDGDGSNLTGITQGITEIDMFYLASGVSLTSSDGTNALTGTWTRFGTKIGTGMSVSGGFWTFPSTGKWMIDFTANWYADSSITSRILINYIHTTTNNTNYSEANRGATYLRAFSSNTWTQANARVTFNVSDTSTHKVLLYAENAGTSDSITLYGGTDKNTNVIFTRLGDAE